MNQRNRLKMIQSKINEEHECPICGEYLVLHKEGTMTNQKTGDFIYVYTCEECNQAFALDDDEKLKLIPYDSEMKKIENECKICKKVENYNEKGLFLLNIDTAYYEFHCFNCAIPILQKWADNNLKNKTKIDMNNIKDVESIYDFNKNNEMLKQLQENPDKYKETMDKVKESLNLNTKEFKKNGKE